MEMKKVESKIRVKNIAVGISKAVPMWLLGFTTTAFVGSMFSDKSFGEIVVDSVTEASLPMKVLSLGALGLSVYGYAGEDSVRDTFNEIEALEID